MNLPEPTEFTKLTDDEITNVLDNLFEPCHTLNKYLVPHIRGNNFKTYTELIESTRVLLSDIISNYEKDSKNNILVKSDICKIVSAHPRLGVPNNKSAHLSVHSKNEQKSLNSGNQNPELENTLKLLNAKYEDTFPGLRFVVFVNGRPRSEIIDLMNHRIQTSNWINEVKIAFNSMCDIALDRAKKLNAKL